MEENWVKWNPINIPEGEFIITDYIQNKNGTKFILDNGNSVVIILFDGIIPIVRSSMEGIRMRTWGDVQQKYDDKFFFRKWFLYKVENSELAKWVEEESCGFYLSHQLTHYCIVTSEEIVDILSSFEPKIAVEPMGQ